MTGPWKDVWGVRAGNNDDLYFVLIERMEWAGRQMIDAEENELQLLSSPQQPSESEHKGSTELEPTETFPSIHTLTVDAWLSNFGGTESISPQFVRLRNGLKKFPKTNLKLYLQCPCWAETLQCMNGKIVRSCHPLRRWEIVWHWECSYIQLIMEKTSIMCHMLSENNISKFFSLHNDFDFTLSF